MTAEILEKFCHKCRTVRDVTQWHKSRSRKDGLATWCKVCQSTYYSEHQKRPGVKERASELAAQRYAAMTSDERRAYIQAGTERRRKAGYHLKQKYGISIEQYEEMLEKQGGGCAICGKGPSKSRRLAVDHDHSCCSSDMTCGGCLRGLLCTTCNVWLGFYENEEWMNRASAYLERRVRKEMQCSTQTKLYGN